MFAAVHNAMSSLEDGFIAYNNLKSLEKALKAGYRGLFLDSCDCKIDGINFCHSFCFAGQRKSLPVFNSIVKFMKENPNEVLVIELQINDDSLSELWEIAPSAFKNYLYSHPGRNAQWPTLNTMINSGKRIIVFQHNGPNCDKSGACPKGVHNTWTYAFETPYDLRGADELLDSSKSCSIRTGTKKNNSFMISNHFATNDIGFPSETVSKTVNTETALRTRLDSCHKLIGKRTNLLVVDFWSLGDVVKVIKSYNSKLTSGRKLSSSTESTS